MSNQTAINRTSADPLEVGRSEAMDASGRPKTQSGFAYDRIREMILEWSLRPGTSVDERGLVASLEMGRTPIREALLRLSEQGLVVFSPNRDIRVAPLDIDTIKDLYEMRLHNDRLAARLFMSVATSDQKRHVLDVFDDGSELIDAGAHRALFDRDFTFHTRMVAFAGNEFLRIYHANLSGHFFRIAFLTYYGKGEPSKAAMQQLLSSHDPILDAIRADDAEALDHSITQHCVESYESVVRHLTEGRLSGIADLSIKTLPQTGN